MSGNSSIDLSGEWQFALDRDDAGVQEEWWTRDLSEAITLPGALQEQGFGDDVSIDTKWVGSVFDNDWFVQERYAPYRQSGNIKVPFWLQPLKRYQGVAWYRRSIQVPHEWTGKQITLTLERPHWSTRVWIGGREAGLDESLSTAHVHFLGVMGSGEQTITIRVDNRILYNVGPNAHSISDHTQTNWNGIVGRLALAAHDAIHIDRVEVTPDVERRTLNLSLVVRNLRPGAATETLAGKMTVHASLTNVDAEHLPPTAAQEIALAGEETIVTIELPLGDGAHLWDEFHPALYEISCQLEVDTEDGPLTSQYRCVTGLREIKSSGRSILLNGRRIFLRGTLECCVFPRTGYPATDLDEWQRIMRICKAHGLNHLRFHSWCPPEAAFMAADQEGIYLQVECASWANLGAALGYGDPVEAWLYAEGERIVRTYGHHPSFVMMAYGNEPGGDFVQWLRTWVDYWKRRDPQRLHTSGAGWPALPENEYQNLFRDLRIQMWGGELSSRINASAPETVTTYNDAVQAQDAPIISHEVGQWCVYPNFDEIAKYNGSLRAHNFEIFRDFLNAHHMGDQAHDFVMASGKLQVLCYKEEIEALLRTTDLGGFHLLDLHDFPGQGTALIGVLDPFWDAKEYVDATSFRRFCAEIVPLALLEKRYWRSSETFAAEVQVAQWGQSALENVRVVWEFVDSKGTVVADGEIGDGRIEAGGLRMLGAISASLELLSAPAKYSLVIAIEGAQGEVLGIENDWDFWLFPDALETKTPQGVHVATRLDARTIEVLEGGGKALLTLPPESVRVESKIGFSTTFWNTSWTKAHGEEENWSDGGQAPHTMGILCDPAHPIFAHFPTEHHSNWQWWELIHGSAAMVLETLPSGMRPLVQVIDTWFECRRLGLLFEAQVAGGRLVVCSMEISTDLENRPVARQMRHSILQYMDSEAFAPAQRLTVDQVKSLCL